MFNRFLLCTILSGLAISAALAQETPAKSKISQVQLYQQGAQVFHTSKLNLSAGTHVIVIDSVSTELSTSTLRTSLAGPATFVSARYRNDAQGDESAAVKQRTERLQDSIEFLQYDIEDGQAELSALQEEQNYVTRQLEAERIDSLPLDVKTVELTADFIGRKLGELKQRIVTVNRNISIKQRQIQTIKDTITTLGIPKERSQVLVTVFLEQAAAIDVGISYMVSSAGWTAAYDVRVPDIGEPMQLEYKARVWQQTDMDWQNVHVSVSTRNPNNNHNHPVVNPWMISLQQQVNSADGNKLRNAQTFDLRTNAVRAQINETSFELNYTTNSGGAQQIVEFSSNVPTFIPMSGEQQMVALTSHEITPLYEFYAVPKLDPDAFLLARIPQWSKYNLLPGNVNIYFRENFVGTTALNPYSVTDTISLSLGRDRNVVIKRNMKRDVDDDFFLSSDVERVYTYSVFIRNTYAEPITLTLEEPIPKAATDDIEVEILVQDGAELHKQKNSLRWRMQLAGSQSAEKTLSYKVLHPEDQPVYGL